MSYEIDKKKIIARMLQETGCKSCSELSRKLGYTVHSAVYEWTRGKHINFTAMLEAFGDTVDWNYIMVGKRGGEVMTQIRKVGADVEKLAKTLQDLEKMIDK